jgi:hypothetical protein
MNLFYHVDETININEIGLQIVQPTNNCVENHFSKKPTDNASFVVKSP